MTLPVALYTAAQTRELDRLAIQTTPDDGYTLMQRAGQRSFDLARRTWPRASLDIVCGAGNNAGDGYVLASLARRDGLSVRVFALSPPELLSGEAALAYADFLASGGRVEARLPEMLAGDVIVDALLGTGVTRALEGEFAQGVSTINSSGKPVLAIDIPSGLSADCGSILGCAVNATTTLTFIGLKRGLFTASGPRLAGDLVFDDLDIPDSVFRQIEPSAWRIDQAIIGQCLKPRPADSHKGRFGRVLVVGGNQGMPGAVRLAGEAALRSGAGVVQIATHPSHIHSHDRPELMIAGVENGEALAPLLAQADVVAVGPGLGTDAWAQDLWQTCLRCGRPMVVDADALNLLAAVPVKKQHWILTPHPGELATLLNVTNADVQAARFAMVSQLQSSFGGVAIAKGAGTLVDDGNCIKLCSLGNPGMSSAGMGDVLTGVIAALLGQGLSLADAAAVGVTVHAAAGDLAADEGQRGLLATDLIERLREVVNP